MIDRQDVFNKAYRGLRAQGFVRSMYAGRWGENCAYNGEGGRHCALGWVWPIPQEYNGCALYDLPNECMVGEPSDEDKAFLGRLQRIHDSNCEPRYMAEDLANFAAVHGLDIPPNDGQDPVLEVTHG